MKLRYVAVLAAVGLAAAALIGVGRPEPARSEDDSARHITVSGTGTVESVPDVASFSFGVDSRASTAKEALAANASQVRRMIEALLAEGVSPKDIRTEQVSLTPRFDNDGNTVVGYSASNSVKAEIDDLDHAGAVVDAAVAAGANQVYGPALSREDQTELYAKALQRALAEARGKAEALAGAADASVGRVLTIDETGAPGPPVLYEARAMALEAPSTPIEPGTERIQAQVRVTFALG